MQMKNLTFVKSCFKLPHDLLSLVHERNDFRKPRKIQFKNTKS